MQSQAFFASSIDELDLKKATFSPTLAICFASIKNDLKAIQAQFAAEKLPVFGSSSAGEILENGGDESVFEENIVLMLLDPPQEAFQLKLFDGKNKSSQALGAEIGDWAKSVFSEPALLLMSSGLDTDGEALIKGIFAQTEEIPIFGGLAADDLQMSQTFVFSHEGLSDKGAVVVVLDRRKISINGIATSGWQAVGNEKKITKSVGNVVYTIDEQPATEVYQEYLGIAASIGGGSALTAEYPLQIIRKEGYPVMRASMMINVEEKSVTYAGSVPEGSMVRFCVPAGVEIIDHALKDMQKLQEQSPAADALILFSCKGRHLALGPMAEDEIKPMQMLWGAPLIGFYTYGEIGKSETGKLDFHNNTCVMVTLKEN